MGTLGWPLVLLALALVLLVAEVFIPSGGMIGVAAVFCLVYSVWLAFAQSYSLGLKFVAADLVLLPSVFALAMHLWPKTPLARRVFLRPPAPEEVEVAHSPRRLDHLVGQVGRALTPLRPCGLVDFDGMRLDGLAEEGLIAPGTPVQAVRIRSGQVVVKAAGRPAPDEPLGASRDDETAIHRGS